MKKILVVRFSSMGDIILTSPVLRAIKTQRPDWVVHYLTKASYAPLVAHNPNIDKLYTYEEGRWDAMISQLMEEGYEVLVDLHHNWRTLRLRRALRCRTFAFPKANIRKWLTVRIKRKGFMDGRHVVRRYFEAVRPLGIESDEKGLEFYIPHYARLKSHDLPLSHSLGYLLFSIGGTYATKRLPAHQWKALAAGIDHPIILLGGEQDRAMGEEIAATDPVKFYNACGKFSLPESAWIVAHSKIVLSNDTGLMHMAAAFGKPILSFWGNTVPEFGMYPFYGGHSLTQPSDPRSLMIENQNLSCRPCSKLGFERCPRGHFKCMNEIPIEKARERLKEWLAATQRKGQGIRL